MKPLLPVLLLFILCGCSAVVPALSVEDSPMLESYPVKGRQGWMLNRQVSFGEYQTSKVKSSWTRVRDARTANGYRIPERNYPDLITTVYKDRDQSYSFQMNDGYGNYSDVYATSKFYSRDLRLGDSTNSIGNILQDIFGKDYSEDLFYLYLFINDEKSPWQLFLDNDAAELKADQYEGIFAMDRENYYRLLPITEMKGKKRNYQVFGNLGYEIVDKSGNFVAAVDLDGPGEVYFHTRDPKERFLMANLAAALLLQQDIAM